MREERHRGFRDAHEDSEVARGVPETEQTRSPAYRLAFADEEFIYRDELRPVRLQLELLKPELLMAEAGIDSTVVLFGGARIPRPDAAAPDAAPGTMGALSHFYDEARRFARAVTKESVARGGRDWVICTGGGPGVMEAGNRGAAEAGGRSIGLSIVLPHEQAPNEYVTPELCFNFHYFGIRKMHFLMRAAAIAVFPGGFGTLDETFEALTLIQTGRMEQVPFLLFGEAFWRRVIDFDALVEAGTISADDLALFRFVETADDALEAMRTWETAGVKRAAIPGR
ncbi:MAG: putative Rossmann fold nucleotide-binding protein [Rhodobacteraceae bacterium HLUCCA09]|nr:MAG: putative Rossmann fold nucleotide-binding protein [Rhodobacteraceae bacterium HLUCCA09]